MQKAKKKQHTAFINKAIAPGSIEQSKKKDKVDDDKQQYVPPIHLGVK